MISITKSWHIDSTETFKHQYVLAEVLKEITEIRVKEVYSDKGKNVLNQGIYDTAR